MTGILETPGVGHNQAEGAEKENQHWERWAKKRTFVRALEGTYSHLYKQLIDQPRVFSSKDVPWKGGPGHYGKSVISPQAVNITQSIESHIEAYAPGASGQKHGHLNSAVFYVLKGRGHDVHDGRHIPWKAGDVMLVENACVHQHFNDDPKEEAVLLVFKAKPLFLFMHLLFQKIVEWPSKIPPKGAEDYKPPADIEGATPWRRFTDREPVTVRHQDRELPRRRSEGVAGIPQGLREQDQRRARRGHALGALRRRADQASRAPEAEHARDVRRGVHAVPQAGREVRRPPPHVGGDHLRGRRLRLRPALGPQVGLPRSVRMGMGGRSPRPTAGSAATTSTFRRSPTISTSPATTRTAG